MIDRRHGTYKIGIEDNVLVTNLYSALNKESANAFFLETSAYFDRLIKPWALITILHEAYPTPQASEEIRDNLKLYVKAGLGAALIVFKEQSAVALTKSYISWSYEGLPVELTFHDDEESAWAWIKDWQAGSGDSGAS